MIRAIILTLALAGCTRTVTVTKEVPVEVRVPVAVACVLERPDEVVPLRYKIAREQWEALSTDQRENLLQAQALDRKAFGDKLFVATAGCN